MTAPPETVATPVDPDVQVPPGVASLSVTTPPVQILTDPAGVMDAGPEFTVTVAVTEHPPTV